MGCSFGIGPMVQTFSRPRGVAHRRGTLPFCPPCRLRLEGGEGEEACCEILELSSVGVAIAIPGAGSSVRQGQHGRLLIGPPEGDHYELPVDVRWVEPSMTRSVLTLGFPTSECWTYRRG